MDVEKWKEELEASINQAIERGNVDQETLEVMRELLRSAKSSSITEFYKDQQ
jgi:hypothetical protein